MLLRKITGLLNKLQAIVERIIYLWQGTTIYEFIHQDKKKGGDLYTYTRHKLKHRNRELYNYKEKIADKKSIDERPEIVKQKIEFGHWEIDLIVRAGNKGAILTMVEISTKMLFMRKLKKGKMAKHQQMSLQI